MVFPVLRCSRQDELIQVRRFVPDPLGGLPLCPPLCAVVDVIAVYGGIRRWTAEYQMNVGCAKFRPTGQTLSTPYFQPEGCFLKMLEKSEFAKLPFVNGE
ncbi:hypothetical protein E4T56_gene13072 [Termitomyces sp. T112]|nr:hypothetical protein E4T56_gene13072 [Termitomyces sp. T112]